MNENSQAFALSIITFSGLELVVPLYLLYVIYDFPTLSPSRSLSLSVTRLSPSLPFFFEFADDNFLSLANFHFRLHRVHGLVNNNNFQAMNASGIP